MCDILWDGFYDTLGEGKHIPAVRTPDARTIFPTLDDGFLIFWAGLCRVELIKTPRRREQPVRIEPTVWGAHGVRNPRIRSETPFQTDSHRNVEGLLLR